MSPSHLLPPTGNAKISQIVLVLYATHANTLCWKVAFTSFVKVLTSVVGQCGWPVWWAWLYYCSLHKTMYHYLMKLWNTSPSFPPSPLTSLPLPSLPPQEYVPLPPSEEGEAPSFQYSTVECLLFAFHQLAQKVSLPLSCLSHFRFTVWLSFLSCFVHCVTEQSSVSFC